MARHKSFGNSNPYDELEPVTFEIYDDTFTCYPAVQGKTLLQFGDDAQQNPNKAVLKFFSVCMPEEEFERFEALIESPDKIVDATTLGEIAGYLVGEYTNRPTVRSSSSTNGGERTARSSGKKRSGNESS